MLIGKYDETRAQAPAPEPGLYTAVIQDAVYYEPTTRDGRDLPGCVELLLDLTGARGERARYTDRIYLRESTLWRLHQLHHALGLTEPMEIEKFVSILLGLHVGVQVTRAGEYTRVRFVSVQQVQQVQQAAPSAPAQPADTEEDQDDGDPLPF